MRDKAALQRQLTQAWARGDIDAADIGRSTRRYDALDAGQRAEFEDLMDSTGPAGAKFLGQVDDASFQAFMDADVDVDVKATSIRRYSDLDDSGQDTFQSLLRDDQVSDEWIRVLGDSETRSEALERALRRIDEETGDGSALEIDGFVTAREMNRQFPDGWEDPFASGSIVTRFKTTGDEGFVRVHLAGNQNGRFLMRQSDIEGLSPAEIESKFSLDYTPEYVSDVTVPENRIVNMGAVEANFGGQRGAKQFNLDSRLGESYYTNRRPLED